MTNLVNIGDLIGGKYEVLDKLGAGGMGQVVKARDRALDRDVAIKLINPDFATAAGEYAIQSFIEEARLTAGIEHPHVLTVYNLDIHTNTVGLSFPYLVLQLYEGGSLADRLKRNGTFSPDACEAILDQICAGLDYAYQEKKIVHLDLKPGNILVDNHDNVKVADFGLAKILHGRQQADTGAGTPNYMSPEQQQGQDIGPFSDVYALGVTLHVLLTGKIPEFDRNQPPYRILDPMLPPAIRTVIETAVHPDPTHRHQTAGELALAFSLALHPARTPTAVPLSSKPAFLTPAPRPLTITTLDPQGVSELQQAMRELGQFCTDNPHINEREVVTYAFKQSGLFAALRYGEPGQDALLEHKHADVVLRATGGRVIGVLEFKRPAVPPQDGLPQLEGQYVPLLLPDVGVLCNGRELIIYRRQGGYLVKPPVLQVDLATASEADARQVHQWLGKRQIDLAHLESYAQALQAFSQSPIPVQGPEEGGGRAFLERFALKPETVFGRLLEAMMQSLPDVMAESDFADGAYTFWKRIYARELKTADLPASWRPFLPNSQRETLYRFMFCLESAYALLARLLLARAMSNHRFPNLTLEQTLVAALQLSVKHDRLPLTAYAGGLQRLFIYTGNQAFETIFASDIFDWWQEIGKVASAQPLGERLAETVLAVFNFDFQPMTGDLLGSLYQSYFDAETRKALGEFYTPPEIVDFILDQVGYTASNPAIRQSRLLDPACGSGTFVIQAVRRYLQASQGQPPADVLLTLLGGLKIVGFDVNPFAVLMAQTNYAAQVIPLYAQAIQARPVDADRLLRLPIPILRTDSLRQEYREGEQSQARAGSVMQPALGLVFTQESDVSIIQAELPVQVSPGQYYEAKIPVPRYDRARQEGWIGNPEEYFTALRVLFQAVAERKGREEQLRLRLEQAGLTPHAPALAHFMQPAARQLVEQMALLQQQYNDGRFLKTLADLALSLVLKGDVQYDYVVGNPPYIRVQTIPELLRRRWEGWYAWASGSFDAYIPFIERAVYIQPQVKGPVIREWLKPGGKMGYIIPNRFLLVNYAEKLREKLPERTAVDLIFDFRDSRVFTAALNYPAILILRRLEDEEAASTIEFPAVRVFADPRKGAEELINETNYLLGHIAAGQPYVQGQYADAFLTDPASLNSVAWLLMPSHERQVFTRIEQAATIPSVGQWPNGARKSLDRQFPTVLCLEDLTLTQSGGFAGYQTSYDDLMVFRLLEDRGDRLLLKPKGAENPNWKGPQQVEIEKPLLRPWLFGRDVERWRIAWDGWYVFYPYVPIEAMEARGDTFVPVTRQRLIPDSQTAGAFQSKHNYTAPFPLIDQDYPYAWQTYLTSPFVERELRGRESGKFKAGKTAELLWYGATYPRGLEYYDRTKLVLQMNSVQPDIALDKAEGYVFQAGGRGGGAYGVVVDDQVVDPVFLAGLMNARTLDYYLKHVSVVFGGKSYSYSDSFIKQYPIKLPATPAEQTAVTDISQLAQELTDNTRTLRMKEQERDAFPVPQLRILSTHHDVYYLHQLVNGQPQARTFHRNKVQFQSQPNGAIAMKFGGTTLVLPHIGIQQMIEAWLRLQSRSTLEVDDLMQLRLPTTQSACAQLLDALHTLEQEIATLQASIQTGEQMLNNTVATFYGMDAQDRNIIEDFLNRF